MYFCIPTWMYFDSYLYTVDNIDWPGESTGSTVSDGHWTLSGWIFRTAGVLSISWCGLQPILSLQVCHVGTQRNNNPSHKTDILCFHKIDWLERCHPYLAPILAIPCLPRSFQNILDALSVMLKCRQLRWLASLRFKAVPRVEIMFRLAQVLVRGAGLIKWYYMIIYKHRLKAWCSICLESMQIRKHWINSN